MCDPSPFQYPHHYPSSLLEFEDLSHCHILHHIPSYLLEFEDLSHCHILHHIPSSLLEFEDLYLPILQLSHGGRCTVVWSDKMGLDQIRATSSQCAPSIATHRHTHTHTHTH